MGNVTGSFLVKLSERPTVIASTHDNTFTLFSEKPNHFFKLKCTAWIMRRSTYVISTPPQISWQPVNKASLLQCRLHLWCY